MQIRSSKGYRGQSIVFTNSRAAATSSPTLSERLPPPTMRG
ncbi:hypothetical protein [Methanoculleus sp. 10]|nr:hypothetical protein [Methanoculleus sp. 10]